ncbi:MAG: AMP-binding protein [Acidimicrobiales bacterium]
MPAPLAHVSGLLHGVLLPGAVGMKVVLMARWDPGRALDLIERERITYMVGPPTFFTAMMQHPSFSSERVDSIRLLSCGGSGVTPSFVRATAAAFDATVKRAYGSTEAPTVATTSSDDDPEKMATTDGRAMAGTELRVDAPAGEAGELWVRGPELAAGYLDAEETAAAFVDGWFHTGDVARLDGAWLTIVGRVHDGIIRGGENISVAEVEQVLEAHLAVRHAVAVGEPDERLGERVAAFVVAPDGFDLPTCKAWFAAQGASRLIVPERIEVLAELPTLPSGKPDRQALRRML